MQQPKGILLYGQPSGLGNAFFSMVNRILSSHSDIRVAIISGIIKIRTLGESNYRNSVHHQRHGQKEERYLLFVQTLPEETLWYEIEYYCTMHGQHSSGWGGEDCK
jgi:hypothetical protein